MNIENIDVSKWNDCSKSVPALDEVAYLGSWNKKLKKWNWTCSGILDDNLIWRYSAKDSALLDEPTHWMPINNT